MSNAHVARILSDVLIWLALFAGLALGAALWHDGERALAVGAGLAAFLDGLVIALILRLLADIADGVWREK